MKRIVVTGGPGAGKTALIELLRKSTCEHVGFVQEAASLLYGGGFPRSKEPLVLRAAQRAIFHVQRELEAIVEPGVRVAICDRGTLDGLAYWPGDEASFFQAVGTTREAELARYDAVIHLHTPGDGEGYGHRNPLRIETCDEARAIDARIVHAWRDHPHRHFITASGQFVAKARRAVSLLRGMLPAECRIRHHRARAAAVVEYNR
jgi:predicted ATPase